MVSLDPNFVLGPSRSVTPSLGDDDGIERHCPCGKWFRMGHPKQRYCSRKCKDRAYNLAHPVSRQRQLPLGPDLAPVPPVVDQTVPIPDCEGLKGQNAAVLARLRKGAATTRELAAACPGSMAIHSRVADCRTYLKRFGETVTRRRVGPRVHVYRIEAL